MERMRNDIKKETYYKDGCSGNPYVKPEEKNTPSNRFWMGKGRLCLIKT